MKGFVIYPTYKIIDGKAFVCLFGRLENGDSFLTINYFKPYFYIKKDDLELAQEFAEFNYEELDFKDFKGNGVVKVVLDIPADVPKLRKKFEDNQIVCYEADIRFPYRFMIDNEIQGSLNINGDYVAGDRVDRIYKEPEIKSAQDYKPKNLRILSFDIESSSIGDTQDQLYCIGFVCGPVKKVFINSEDKVDGAVSCKDEEEVLEKFINEIIDLDPDVITGWNVIDFDFAYLSKKCKKYKIDLDIGREPGNCKVKIEESFFRESKVDVSGRQVLDALHLLRVSFIKVEDYKLDTVAYTILGDRKLIQTQGLEKFKEIDELFQKNKKRLAEYNLKDAELVVRILEKTKVLELSILRSLLTGMPLDRVDASIASFDSLYTREAMKRKIVVPTGSYVVKEERIKGGYVRESIPGIYSYIIILDFKSLYPSIIRTFNIDPYSYVQDCKGRNLIKAPNGACFRNENGILPMLIQRLWGAREIARKERDELTRHAIKILMNSFFGVLGNPACRFFDINMTNAITYFGQHIIKLTSQEIEKLGYNVIYNDSITNERFVTLLINNKLEIKNIEELFNDYKSNVKKRGNKEVINLYKYNIKALTLNTKNLKPKFSKLNEIIRHRTNKKIYRVNQKHGETRCTEDHSIIILDKNKLKEAKPRELNNMPLISVKYNGYLKRLHKIDLYEFVKNYEFKFSYKGSTKIDKIELFKKDYLKFGWMNRKNPILLKRYVDSDSKEILYLCRLLGFYIAEGSSSTKDTTYRVGASISNSNVKILKEMQNYYNLFFKGAKTSIIKSTKKIRKLKYERKTTIYIDKTNKLQMMNSISAIFFKELCSQKSKNKKIPNFIFHLSDNYKIEFLKYMKLGDGSSQKNNPRYSEEYVKNNFSYTSSSLHLISGLSFLLNQLSINYSIQYRPKKKAYTIQTSNKNNVRYRTKVIKERYNGYVYDLNVEENHMFVDACGQILLHNTDSNFVISNAKNQEEADKIGKKIQDHINKFYRELVKKDYDRESFLELSYDKCFVKCIMPRLRKSDVGAKKRYAGLVIKDGKEEIQFTGLEAKRGDWTELAKKYQYELLNRIFHNKDVVDFTKKFVDDIKKGKYDSLLVYKKSIRKELQFYTKTTPPHVRAARKLEFLESNKIEYVLTQDGPEPVQNLKHKIDYEHYIEKQIMPIADSVLVFFNKSFEEIIKGNKQTDLGSF